MPRVTVAVTNDLTNDQRVHKVCTSLMESGWEVYLVGRKLPDSAPLLRLYPIHRMKLYFKKGALFYAEYNLRLFFHLLSNRTDVLHSNDLDTLLPNYLISRMRRVPLVYDTHEYFLGVPELEGRAFAKGVWTKIEQWIFPKLKTVFTVNRSIADLYEKDYGVRPRVMRNISKSAPEFEVAQKTRGDWGLPEDAFLMINQGTGINVDRGMEEAMESLLHSPDDVHLVLVGKGDVMPKLKKNYKQMGLVGRVHFIDPQPYDLMLSITKLCDVGISLDKDTNVNYRFSLPNKLFDYIRAGIPIISTRLVEVANVVETYQVGITIEECTPELIAAAVAQLRAEGTKKYLPHLEKASEYLTWEEEVKPLVETYRQWL